MLLFCSGVVPPYSSHRWYRDGIIGSLVIIVGTLGFIPRYSYYWDPSLVIKDVSTTSVIHTLAAPIFINKSLISFIHNATTSVIHTLADIFIDNTTSIVIISFPGNVCVFL